MALREWPLVLFTLLGQLAVGSYLLLALPVLLSTKPGAAGEGRDVRLYLILTILGIMAAAMLAAFFHLGNPLNALNSLNNLGRSWLSREIFFLALTLGLLAALVLARLIKLRSPAVATGLAWAAGISAMLFLISMTRLYMLPTVPAWNTFFTPASFFLTAFLLGAVTAVTGAGIGVVQISPVYFRIMLISGVLLAVLSLIITALAAPAFGLWGPAAPPGLKPPADPSVVIFAGRLAFLLAGAVLLAAQWKKAAVSTTSPSPLPALAAFGCILMAEIAGRFLFYAFYLGKR